MRLFLILFFLTATIFAKLNVVVSIPPQKYILNNIAKDLVNSTVVVKPGNSPHTYEPKPSQMVAISKANIYFAIGVEFENIWLDRFKNQNSKLIIIKTQEGIKKIPVGNKDAKKLDPHIWLDPKNIEIIAKNMAKALIEQDPTNKAFYQSNLEEFLKEVNRVDKEIEKKLSGLRNRKFLVFHPSWGYFAKRYNLVQIAIEVEGKEPSPKELIKIIKLAKKEKVRAIFTQPEFSQKSAKLIAKELGIKVVAISPLEQNILQNLLKFTDALIGE